MSTEWIHLPTNMSGMNGFARAASENLGNYSKPTNLGGAARATQPNICILD